MTISIVILAAGQGKRMHSDLPKVLHRLGGKALLEHVVKTASEISPTTPIVIYGHQGETLKHALAHLTIQWVLQKEQAGTGHALLQALPHLKEEDRVLVLYGDVPLISSQTLNELIKKTPPSAIGMLTANLAHPKGYGRIKRHQGNVVKIVEEKDATEEERAITEINSGIYLLGARHLKKWLPHLKNINAQQEYYLTDVIAHAVSESIPIHTLQPMAYEEILGVNDRLQLAHLERFYQRRQAEKLLLQGVTLMDPNRIDIRGELKAGKDVVIDVNTLFEGNVVLGNGCLIGPNVILRNAILGDRVEIKANSVIEEAKIDDESVIGPFARLRPGTLIHKKAHIGNFVEVKNSRIDEETKINHLSYIGDSEIGKRVNIGAGTITCNYDGANKHKTIILDDVHVGSDTQLVAPVTVGRGATIGAGSTVTKDVPPEGLTLTHQLNQRTLKWQRPKKNKTER